MDQEYANLQEEAREGLAQLPEQPPGIRQCRPKSMDDVLTATLEKENYMYSKTTVFSCVWKDAARLCDSATVRDIDGSEWLIDGAGQSIRAY